MAQRPILDHIVGTREDGQDVRITGVENNTPLAIRGDIVESRASVGGIVAGAFSSGDVVGTLVYFSNVVRAPKRGGLIESATLIESTTQGINAELWLFDRPVTPAADNAAHSITDADALFLIPGGVISLTSHFASALNSVSVARGVGVAFQCSAERTDLWGILVTRGTPTYAAGGIVLKLGVIQE